MPAPYDYGIGYPIPQIDLPSQTLGRLMKVRDMAAQAGLHEAQTGAIPSQIAEREAQTQETLKRAALIEQQAREGTMMNDAQEATNQHFALHPEHLTDLLSTGMVHSDLAKRLPPAAIKRLQTGVANLAEARAKAGTEVIKNEQELKIGPKNSLDNIVVAGEKDPTAWAPQYHSFLNNSQATLAKLRALGITLPDTVNSLDEVRGVATLLGISLATDEAAMKRLAATPPRQETIQDTEGNMWIRHPDGSTSPVTTPEGSQLKGELKHPPVPGVTTPFSVDVEAQKLRIREAGRPPVPAMEPLGPGDPASNDILSQTGLSVAGFYALTGQNAKLPRDAATRRAAMLEAGEFARKRGVDISVMASQYAANNAALAGNVLRLNNTKIMEGEVLGTIENLQAVVKDKDLSRLNRANVIRIWAGQEVNDGLAQQYATHLQQLRNQMSAYLAATQGRSGNQILESDQREAERVIKNGLAAGSLSGLSTAIVNETEKMKGVLEKSVDRSTQAVWNLFGVGQNYKPKTSPSQQISPATHGSQPNVIPPMPSTLSDSDVGKVYLNKTGQKKKITAVNPQDRTQFTSVVVP